jgi:ERCC4-related helicase
LILVTFVENEHEIEFSRVLNNFAKKFYKLLNPEIFYNFEIQFENLLKNILNKKIEDANVYKNQKIAKLLQKILTVIEILGILGLNSTIKFLTESLEQEEKNNCKSKTLNEYEMGMIRRLKSDVERFSGESNKINQLCFLLRQQSDRQNTASKVLIFVRRRKTARLLCEYLKKNEKNKKF